MSFETQLRSGREATALTRTHQPSNSPTLSPDDAFHLLQNERRRGVIRYLADHSETVSVRELADHVAAWEYDRPVDELTDDQRQRVYISLYQSHLEKLANSGVLEYDQEENMVRLTGSPAPLLDRMNEFSESDDRTALDRVMAASWYVAVGCLGGLLGTISATSIVWLLAASFSMMLALALSLDSFL